MHRITQSFIKKDDETFTCTIFIPLAHSGEWFVCSLCNRTVDDGLVVCNDLYVITCKMVSGCMWKFCHHEEDGYYVHDFYICVIGRCYVDFLSLTR